MKRPLVIALALLAAPALHAEESGRWQVRIGAHQVDPTSGNGTLAGGTLRSDLDGDFKPTISLEYYLTPHLGIDVLAAAPFRHELRLNGAKAAEVRHLPPTVSLNWHFLPDGKVSPFVGVGLNYTRFFSIDEYGPLEGTRLSLGDSFGLAAHVGVDIAINKRWAITLDARWMDIDTDVKVDGVRVGTVSIDPFAFGVAAAYRF